MYRDLPVVPQRRRFSTGASAKFFYLAEAIARVYEPTQTQLSDLDRAYRSTGEYLVTCPEFDGLLYQVHAHGSRQLGTMVRPMDEVRVGFDIDLAACLAREGLLRYGGTGGPARLIEHLFIAVKRYADGHGLKIERDDRCVTITYAGGMKADFAPIIDDSSHIVLFGDTHGRIPDRDLQRYISTNPRGYCQLFDKIALIAPAFERRAELGMTFDSMREAELLPLPDAEEVFARLLSRLVQLTKINRNIAFGAPKGGVNLAPPSSFLTTLTANAYEIEAPKPHDGPMDLLLDIVALMPRLVEVITTVPRVLRDPAPAVHLNGFGADGLDLTINYWIGDPENGQGAVRSAVNLAVLAALDAAGVEIPFPQRVLRQAEPWRTEVAAQGADVPPR